MDPAEKRYLEDDDTPMMKTIKGATMGLVSGTIFGTVVATWYDVPRVERNVALPGLIRTLKMMGNYGATFAAIGGVYIGVEQLVQHYRMKRDFVNGAVGGFVAGSTILGYRGKIQYIFNLSVTYFESVTFIFIFYLELILLVRFTSRKSYRIWLHFEMRYDN